MSVCAAPGFERAPRCIASKFLTCVWFAFVTITLVTYTAGIVNNLYWASMTHKSSPTRPRYLDLAHVVNSKDVKYGTIDNSQTYWYVTIQFITAKLGLTSYYHSSVGTLSTFFCGVFRKYVEPLFTTAYCLTYLTTTDYTL